MRPDKPMLSSIMKANTYHYVVTLNHSVCYGGHFLSTASLQKTLIGYVHTAMLGYCITNTLHPEVKRLLFRIMINWGCNGTQVDRSTLFSKLNHPCTHIINSPGRSAYPKLANTRRLAQPHRVRQRDHLRQRP